MLAVVCQVHVRHAAAAQQAAQLVTVAQRRREVGGDIVGHGGIWSRVGAAATRVAPQNGAVASAHRPVPATENCCVQASCRSAAPAALPARLLPVCDTVPMAIAPGAPPIVLIASVEEHPLVGALERRRYAVVQVQTGALAVEWARNFQPDAIMLAADLPDMTGIDASRLLHADLRIGHNVPILIIATDKPTPEQRVAALRAGAWDFVRHPGRSEEHTSELQSLAYLVCRLLLEKKKTQIIQPAIYTIIP